MASFWANTNRDIFFTMPNIPYVDEHDLFICSRKDICGMPITACFHAIPHPRAGGCHSTICCGTKNSCCNLIEIKEWDK